MAAVAPPADQAAELLQKLSLDSQAKSLEIPEPTKKPSSNQFGAVDGGDVANGQNQLCERSVTPLLQEFMDPSMCYVPNGYSSYYYGGYDGTTNEWEDYSRYMNPEGVEMSAGVYGDNGSIMYHHGYGYAPYGPYPPAGSPVPTVGHDGQLYGPQHYQYPTPYFQPPTPTSGPYNPSPVAPPPGEVTTSVAADQKPLSVETANGNSNGLASGGVIKGGNGTVPVKPTYPNTPFNSNGSYGRGALPGGVPASGYQDPRFCFDGIRSPLPWLDGPVFSDPRPVTSTSITSSITNANNAPASRNHHRPHSHFMGLQHPRPMSGMGTAHAHGFMNRMYPNKIYGQYGNSVRNGLGFGPNAYDSRTNGRSWLALDNKYKPRGRGVGFFGYGNENMDGLNELNRGPRAKSSKNQKGLAPVTTKDQNVQSNGSNEEVKDRISVFPDREQYNLADFPVEYTEAKFFIIKSYSEDDVHKSIKYNVWASTPNGNKKLDAAYREAQDKSVGCPVFLFFSVNTSGQFVGLAEMVGNVDFHKNVEYWQQDKWNGSFPVKWHIVKDVPNSLLKHITLENNENKPVTNSRDTQEVKLEQGLQLLKIFKEHSSKTFILDDFAFYEARQKTIQEKKAKQQQFQKQVWEGKPTDEKNGELKAQKPLEVASDLIKESTPAVQANGDRKVFENGTVAKSGDAPKVFKPSVVSEKRIVANGVANGC